MSRRLKLRDHHPTVIKLDKLMTYADTLGINITFRGMNTIVTDKDQPKKEFFLVDIEDTGDFGGFVHEFPYPTEWKLIIEEE